MGDALTLLIGLVALALIFDFLNGMHDSANAITTVVSTRVLSPRTAVIFAAVLNFGGAFLGTAVARTIGKELVDPLQVTPSMVTFSLVSAILWNVFSWKKGIPSSSSQALIGGIIGAAIPTHGFSALYGSGVIKVIGALIVAPLAAFAAGLIIMIAIMWIFHRSPAGKVNRWFKYLQLFSASLMAIGHGSNDAQKAMGIITLGMMSLGFMQISSGYHIPSWVVLLCASGMALGTAVGGWRLIKSRGIKMIRLAPVHGFAAETAASLSILTATHLGMPISTSHVLSSSILGVGSAKGTKAVRWEIAGQIGMAWVLTIPCSALLACWMCWIWRLLISSVGR